MAQPETLSLAGRRVAFTTPQTTSGGGYGGRLHELLRQRGAQPLPVPTIAIRAHEPDRLRPLLLPGALDPFAALALCRDPGRVTVLVPDVPIPAGLVEALGRGSGRRVLCPVPDVDGLREPPVVPDFLAGLEAAGWVAVRAPAYTTCWAGPGCAEVLVAPDATAPDAIVFTSSSEVEGLLKGLDAMGWSWPRLRARWPDMVVAAHGPVTADGVRRLGIEVDVVSSRFSSFHRVLDSLAATFSPKHSSRFSTTSC
ncbi:hypothetical protein BRADI_4g34013v3 [Brachypodium distachyon]|uniref:Tetrapyrrole biosynthesis uroporphyrinogen III synthase domain-containing protein n=1 Tax=Brachypodium distachyon TaxID=15368 RepID=A0A0Q3EWP2_BRADI|nr:hypothetical protein BRADI_4g34013v3 [Brachypodium distachyon]